jgi:hypothetical protein
MFIFKTPEKGSISLRSDFNVDMVKKDKGEIIPS